MRHKNMVIGALVALVTAAFATLAVPIGVRRMIDIGFSNSHSETVNNYFLAMFAVGLLLAVASAARFYFVSWLGGENCCGICALMFFARLAGLSPAFYDVTHSGEVMSRLTADTTQNKKRCWHICLAGPSKSDHDHWCHFDDVCHQSQIGRSCFAGYPRLLLFPWWGWDARCVSFHVKRRIHWQFLLLLLRKICRRSAPCRANDFSSAVTERFSKAVEKSFEAARVRMKARGRFDRNSNFSGFCQHHWCSLVWSTRCP